MNHSTVAKGAFLVACAILLIGVAWIALHGSGPSPGINQMSIAGSYMVTKYQPDSYNYCVINEVSGKQDEYTITLSTDLGAAGETLNIKKNDRGEMVFTDSGGSSTEVISGDNGSLAFILPETLQDPGVTTVITLVPTVRMDRIERYTSLTNSMSVWLNQKTGGEFTPTVSILLNATGATHVMTGQLQRDQTSTGFTGELTALTHMSSSSNCRYQYKLYYLGDKILFKITANSPLECEHPLLPPNKRFSVLEYTKSNEPNE